MYIYSFLKKKIVSESKDSNLKPNIIHSFHPCYITFAPLHTLQRALHGQLRIKPVEYGNPVDIYISQCVPACAM